MYTGSIYATSIANEIKKMEKNLKKYTPKEKMQSNFENIKNYFKDDYKLYYNSKEIIDIYNQCIINNYIYARTTLTAFKKFLIMNDCIQEPINLDFPNKTIIRYFKKEVNPFELALSIHPKAYFSHYTAAFIHGLTNNIPKIIYINVEKRSKVENNLKETLNQKSIDKAFYSHPRISQNLFIFKNYTINLLNGKYTNNLGVQSLEFKDIKVKLTNIERTLIDLAVSPYNCGGTYEVLSIFKNAKGSFSPQKMAEILKELDYIYPFHQAIGFYLEKAEYNETDLKCFEAIEIKHKFYLEKEIQFNERKFSERWNLFYPKFF